MDKYEEQIRAEYNELDHYISTLENLKDDCKSKDLISDIDYALLDRKTQLDELEQELNKIESEKYEIEMKEREREVNSFRL